jgi:hypothetical protein
MMMLIQCSILQVIAIYTFIIVWCRNDSIGRNLTVAYILLGIIWLFILLFVVVGITVHTGGGDFYETPTPVSIN